jgi:hypothetical protein
MVCLCVCVSVCEAAREEMQFLVSPMTCLLIPRVPFRPRGCAHIEWWGTLAPYPFHAHCIKIACGAGFRGIGGP